MFVQLLDQLKNRMHDDDEERTELICHINQIIEIIIKHIDLIYSDMKQICLVEISSIISCVLNILEIFFNNTSYL